MRNVLLIFLFLSCIVANAQSNEVVKYKVTQFKVKIGSEPWSDWTDCDILVVRRKLRVSMFFSQKTQNYDITQTLRENVKVEEVEGVNYTVFKAVDSDGEEIEMVMYFKNKSLDRISIYNSAFTAMYNVKML